MLKTIMIEPVEDITRKEGRESALEMWAAQIYADQSRQGRGAGQEGAVGTGGSTVRKDLHVKQAQQVKEVAKTEETATVDTHDTVSPSVEVPEFKRLDQALARLQATRTTPPAPTTAPAVTAAAETLQEKPSFVAETLVEQAPTPQETAAVSVSTFKPMSKSEASRETSSTSSASEAPETDEEQPATPRIVPGNSPKARAYVPAATLMGNSPQREFYEDFLVAL